MYHTTHRSDSLEELIVFATPAPEVVWKSIHRTELLGGKLDDASEVVVVGAVSALPELGNVNWLVAAAATRIVAERTGVCM